MHWHGVLELLLGTTMYLSGRGLAFRGSSDRLFTAQNGNFLGLVELLGKYDDVLKEHLRQVLAKEISDHYCSKRIQGELLELLAKRVQETILSCVKKSQVLHNHSGLHARRKS
jgi:ClpP class serine protease